MHIIIIKSLTALWHNHSELLHKNKTLKYQNTKKKIFIAPACTDTCLHIYLWTFYWKPWAWGKILLKEKAQKKGIKCITKQSWYTIRSLHAQNLHKFDTQNIQLFEFLSISTSVMKCFYKIWKIYWTFSFHNLLSILCFVFFIKNQNLSIYFCVYFRCFVYGTLYIYMMQ